MKKILIYTFLLGVILIGTQSALAKTKPEILGLRIGMNMEQAHKVLQKIGKKDKDESKLQEVWMLSGDKSYSHIIIGFNKDIKTVRFINAKARAQGKRVRYTDVIDVKKATREGTANNYKYVIEVPAKGDQQGYKIIARGTDKDYLTYFAVEQIYTIAQK